MLTERQWAMLEPLLDLSRPRGKTPPHDLRGTVEAILWRHCHRENWRAVPPHYGPWWRAAQTFNRWSKHQVWQVVVDRLIARFGENGWPVPPAPEAGGAGAARQDELRTGDYQVRYLIGILNGMPTEPTHPARSVPLPAAGDGASAQPTGTGREAGEMTRSLLERTEFAITQAASLRSGPPAADGLRPSSRY